MFSKKSGSEIYDDNYPKLIPQDISPADDAFHGSPKRVAAEWWYFDAIFNNNYSAHIGFKTFSRKKLGMVSPNIEFYKDGKLVVKTAKRYLFRNFETSKEVPLAKLFNKPVIEFDQDRYKNTGEWVYHFKLKIDDNAVDLTFIGVTKGWKIETDYESWTVALPKATVSGEIIVNGKKMSVDGIGYHDHNWNYSMLTVMNYGRGWYWGKIIGESFNIVWANIIKSARRSQLIAVVNRIKNGFFNIDPKNIHFKAEKFKRVRGRKTPTCFTLQIDDVVEGIPIKADVKMESENIHYGKALLADYWRYHIRSNGDISVGSTTETLENKIQIIEFLNY